MVHNVLDPYFELLAIPPAEQPPTLYRLLGVPVYTDNKNVITNAAAQRMQFLRRVGGEKFLNDVQRILNEVSEAKLLLLNDTKRQSYDARLRQLEHQPPSHSTTTPPARPATPTKPTPLDKPKSDLPASETTQANDAYRLADELTTENGNGGASKVDSSSPRPARPTPTSQSSSAIPSSFLKGNENEKDYYRQNTRPLRSWNADDPSSTNVDIGNIHDVAPISPSFPTRHEAAKRKADEIQQTIDREKAARAREENVVFRTPPASQAIAPGVIMFLDGPLAGISVAIPKKQFFFRLRRNGHLVPIEGNSKRKPNLVFQEMPQGWHCVTTRSIVVNNRLKERAICLRSGDVFRLNANGPLFLWLDQAEVLPESNVVKMDELQERFLMGSRIDSENHGNLTTVERNVDPKLLPKKKTDPAKFVIRLATGIAVSILLILIVRAVFFR